MNGWKECKLGEVADIVMGQSPKSETCNTNQKGLPLLNGPTEYGIKHPKPVQYTIDPKRLAKKGDILFCVRGSTTGRMNWADQEYAIGRGIAAVRHKQDKNINNFIKGLIDYYLPSLLSGAAGSVFPNITGSQLSEVPIILPPLPEQRAIAGVLSSLDDKIDLLHRQNKTLEGMAEALWRKMFVEEADPGWKKKKLGDICQKITKGTTPTTLKKNFVEEGINFVKVESIDEIGQFIAEKFAHIDEVTHKLLQRSILKENDILYSIAGTIGRIAVVTEEILPANTNQALAIIRLRDIELHLPFVKLLLKTSNMTDDLGSKIVHAVQPNLSLGEIAETEFIMPEDRNLAVFNLKVNGLFSKINLNTQQIRTLSKTRDTLLPKLMSGDVKVKT